ncbi:MAG: glycosyl hydrolase-related protein [Candidatus Cloacimonetes bacterium]|nr:glycosyl hydrolase-related protein [Candidatus Cloacimonadota bacterium]
MQNEKIHLERIKRFIAKRKDEMYQMLDNVPAEYIKSDEPIPYATLEGAEWKAIQIGEVWNKVWGSAWFRVRGKVSRDYSLEKQGLYFDSDGEGCVMVDGSPYMGLTPKVDWYHNAAKHYIPLAPFVDENGEFELLIEAAANDLFGAAKEQYSLRVCSLCLFDEEVYELAMDMELLNDLAINLPGRPARRAKIIHWLNQICNIYADDPAGARVIAKDLLNKPAHASAMEVYSVGHAHLDLAWLWPLRESHRKGGRSFANALRMIELYPEYIFGASQAQLYKWIKDDYPLLFDEVKEAVRKGSWEVQGATWTEFDTNLPSGESLIRQFVYGRRFFMQEFGFVPNYLWLPDCFGFSGNLPQIIKGCGVDFFITQKLSWNETNVFDKHLFIWQGIDGSEVRAHQLPTNDYNSSNNPASFIIAEGRFEQAEIAEGFLNLYGIGDGGGGPTRNHIEYGLRQRDLEGACKFRFSKAQSFFDYYATIPQESLPKAYTELYLEFHRGTYTTQGQMKKDNFVSERLLAAAEWFAVLNGIHKGKQEYPEALREIWEDTLLLQFHDILPGSSITSVYEDSRAISQKNHDKLARIIDELFICDDSGEGRYALANPAPVEVMAWLSFPRDYQNSAMLLENAVLKASMLRDDELALLIEMPAFSIGALRFEAGASAVAFEREDLQVQDGEISLQVNGMQLKVNARGSISSLVRDGREFLAGESNLIQLWEDEPNNWGAWDINHYYRETTPKLAQEVQLIEAYRIGDYHKICHEIKIGKSTILQRMEILPGESQVRISHDVDWQEHHKMLRVAFCSNVMSQSVECGIQMGRISRSARPKNLWEKARFDFPAQGFIAQSEPGRTVGILAAGKYGFSALENMIDLTLLRSPADVDPTADIGKHSYTYGFVCENKGIDEMSLHTMAEGLDRELIAKPGVAVIKQMPDLIEQNGVNISTIKPAEEGDAIVLRLYEPAGRETFPVIKSGGIQRCNMIEEPLESLSMEESFRVKPFEIVTLKLEKKK